MKINHNKKAYYFVNNIKRQSTINQKKLTSNIDYIINFNGLDTYHILFRVKSYENKLNYYIQNLIHCKAFTYYF